MRRDELLWLLAVLTLGLVVRGVFLWAGGGVIDSDEAIVGLMAKHIAEGQPWPIFYYGQPYMGSLEPTLAALLFLIFGVSGIALKAVPVLFSLAMIPLGYLLGKRYLGTFGGRVASLYLAVPPVAFVEWGTKARGGFIELVFLGTVSILLTERLLRVRSWERKTIVVLGLLLGLSWWTNNQAIFYIAAIGFTLLVDGVRRFRVSELLSALIWGGGAFILGSAPFWYFNLFQAEKFQTFTKLSGRASVTEMLSHFLGVFEHSLPILLGGKRFWTADDLFPGSSLFVLLLLFMGMVVFLRNRSPFRLLLGSFFGFTILIFSVSSFGWLTQAPRYLLPLYSVFPLLFAGLVVACRTRVGGAVALLSVLLVNLSSNYLGELAIPGQPFVSGGDRVSVDHTELYSWLNKQGVTHIHTNYWIGYRVAFETGERVTFTMFGEPDQVRLANYERVGEPLERWSPVVTTLKQGARLKDALARSGFSFKEEFASGYLILHSFTPISPLGPEVDLSESKVTVSHHPDAAGSLVDRSLDTRWGSASPQKVGMAVQLRLKEGKRVGNLELNQGQWKHDAAEELTVFLIRSDGSEHLIFEGRFTDQLLYSRGIFRVSFPVEEAAGFRIINRSEHPVLDWSIAEIKLFEELPNGN